LYSKYILPKQNQSRNSTDGLPIKSVTLKEACERSSGIETLKMNRRAAHTKRVTLIGRDKGESMLASEGGVASSGNIYEFKKEG